MKNKWLRRKRNTLGYGVQSPNDFYFVQHVLHEESPYYSYAMLKKIAQKYSTYLPHYPEATNKLLFRLTNYTQPNIIIEMGAGLSVFAMAMACPSARCTAITASESCYSAMYPLLHEHKQVVVKNGDEMLLLREQLCQTETIDLLHVAHTVHYKESIEAALPYVTDRTLIVIEGIHTDKEINEWWKNLQESNLTGITYDLGAIGLLFFDHSRHKSSYWINFK